jgi:hypothetical protein
MESLEFELNFGTYARPTPSTTIVNRCEPLFEMKLTAGFPIGQPPFQIEANQLVEHLQKRSIFPCP